MNFPESVDRKTVVKVIACVDIVQPLFLIILRGKDIVIRSKVDDENPLRLNQSSTVLVVKFVVIACFLLIHLTMALKLVTATEQMNTEILSAARHAKVWQNWSIVYLILLIAHIFSNILSAQSKLYIVLETMFGIVEIGWRLFAIYNVGKFIDDILFNFPSMAPTVQFFAVRFPQPPDYTPSEA